MTVQVSRPKRTLRHRLDNWLRRNDHRRLADVFTFRGRWHNWGPRLQALVGQDRCGSWEEPSPPTWYYNLGRGERMFYTNYPIHPVYSIEVIKDFNLFIKRTEGLSDDEMYEWKAICVNQDGDLHLGKQYWGGDFHGLNEWEIRLLHRYLWRWRLLDWFGARSWLWKIGLQASVHHKIPFRCNEVPPPGSGYSHWHCSEKKRHKGQHRFNSYVWSDGEDVEFDG